LVVGRDGGDTAEVSIFDAVAVSFECDDLGVVDEAVDHAAATTGRDPVTPVFPRITPHDLRHTAASLAVSAGAHVKAVQKMLGHASAAKTLGTYADLFDRDAEAVADAHDQRLSGVSFPRNVVRM
jgi:integrase